MKRYDRRLMRKKVRKQTTWAMSAFAALAVLLLAGCSSDAAQEEMNTGEPVPVSIDAALDAGTITSPEEQASDASRVSGASSRASTNTSLAVEGKMVKLFLTDANASGTKYTNKYGVLYTYRAAQNAWISDTPFYVDARKANIYACYDPNGVVTFNSNSTKTSSQLMMQFNDDSKLWYYDSSNTNIDNTKAKLNFTLKCAYSRLSLRLSKTADYPGACKVSQVTLKPGSGTFYTSAFVDIATGALSGNSRSDVPYNTTGLSMYTTGLTTTPDTSLDWLFPAQKLALGAGFTFTLSVDGAAYSVTVPSTKFNEFKRGVRYTANLQMSGTGLVINSVTTTDWPAVTNISADSTFD